MGAIKSARLKTKQSISLTFSEVHFSLNFSFQLFTYDKVCNLGFHIAYNMSLNFETSTSYRGQTEMYLCLSYTLASKYYIYWPVSHPSCHGY